MDVRDNKSIINFFGIYCKKKGVKWLFNQWINTKCQLLIVLMMMAGKRCVSIFEGQIGNFWSCDY